MANIAINNYCNLRCKYCFADNMMKQENKNITVNELRTILAFLSRRPRGRIGIIGGEPTLHPDFKEIMKEITLYCSEMGTNAMLFTNGTNLENYLSDIGMYTGVLINVNSPQYVPEKEYQKTMNAIKRVAEIAWFDTGRATIGCNVYPGLSDYTYIWDIVEKYHLDHIRTSVVSPGGCYIDMRNDKDKYYTDMKPIFLEHCKNAIEHDCRLDMDCGNIPECYFTEDELNILHKACSSSTNKFCEPVVDITPDFKATSCFGAYDPVDIRNFEDLVELERYLLIKKVLPKVQKNNKDKCASCKEYDLLQCQGGCLGFTIV